jgi:hypothetical protein
MDTRLSQVRRCQEPEHAVPCDGAGVTAKRGTNGASLAVVGEGAGTSRGLPAQPRRPRGCPGHPCGQRRAGILHGMPRRLASLLLTEAEHTETISVRATVDPWLAGALAAAPAVPGA